MSELIKLFASVLLRVSVGYSARVVQVPLQGDHAAAGEGRASCPAALSYGALGLQSPHGDEVVLVGIF